MSAVQRASSATLGVVVFGLLVVATVGAFFVTQRLKRATPIVRKVDLPRYISPNGDGRLDRVRISFFLPKRDHVTVVMVNAGGDEVIRLADDRLMRRGFHSFVWRGRDTAGAVPPDGTYYLRVILRGQGRATTVPRGIQLVTTPPRPRLLSVKPGRLRPGGAGPVTITYAGPTRPPAQFSVYRTGAPGPPRLVARFTGRAGSRAGTWDGTGGDGRPLPAGTYAFAVTVRNAALVAGSAPARLPPTAASAPPHTGVTIAGLAAALPLRAARAGRVARIEVEGARGSLRWSLARLDGRVVSRGRASGPIVRLRVPRRARTALYVVRLRGGGSSAAVPLAVRGPGRGRVLVVLPAISWQGLNPVDDDGNGFPDTLPVSPSVGLARPLAFGRLPAPLLRETAPLLRYLDGQRLRYDLTTDLALARGAGPPLAGHRGVLFAGSELWLTEALDSELRGYVDRGGRVASFGADAFRRTVRLTASTLSDPSARQETNVFGEATRRARSEAAPLVVHADKLGLFAASDGFVGLFTRFEQQQSIVSGARTLAAAGRDPRHPAFVAYRLGKGVVVRAGAPGWARAIRGEPEVAAATRATWALLSR